MDMQRIDTETAGELERWAAQLGVTPEVLADAVRMVGTDVDELKGHLASVQAQRARQPGEDGTPST